MTRRARHGAPSQRAGVRDTTRARIVQATIDSVAAQGAAGASLGAIVRRAGVSRSLVGYHFGSKADLLVAAFEQLCDGYREMLGMLSEEPTADPVEAASKLDEALRKSFVWPARFRERQYAYFGFWAMARTDAKLRVVNRRVYDEVAAYLGMLLGSIARARGRTINEKAAGLELSATIDGAWLHLTTGVDGFTREIALRICSECVARILERDDVPSGPS